MRRTAFLLLTALALGCNTAEPPEEHIGKAEQAAESLTAPSRPNAIRLLEQATFGPKLADIDHVMTQGVGISGFVTEQLAKPAGVYTGWNADNNAVPPIAARDVAQDVFEHALSGDDQLRQRVTLALSQIFVTSLVSISNHAVMADYLSMLRRDALGNFRTMLEDVTLHPMMGRYLNMANNNAFDAAGTAIAPDENYAREVMQLFTMGLEELNDDGTLQYDCNGDGVYDVMDPANPAVPCNATNGKRIPTYSQDNVENLAHALTGWTYTRTVNGVVTCPAVGGRNNPNYTAAMIPCDVNHDKSAKEILKGKLTTANLGTQAHLTQALDFIFKDNSTPPYICKQLIQHLVTANPTPAYVGRVVAKFKNNGSGVRGDMAAVVRAILQDDEARGPVPVFAQQATYGHLRPPMLLITNAIRWLNGSSTKGATLNSYSSKMGQNIGRAPSVFSFYPPGFQLPDGSGLLGPEFAIVSSATSLERANFLNALFFTGVSGTTIDWTVIPDDPALMLQWMDDNIMHDTMSSQMKSIILDAITNPSVPTSKKKPLAMYLAMTSSDYQTER